MPLILHQPPNVLPVLLNSIVVYVPILTLFVISVPEASNAPLTSDTYSIPLLTLSIRISWTVPIPVLVEIISPTSGILNKFST